MSVSSRMPRQPWLAHAQATGTVLVSGVPRQLMRSLGELLTVPMINLLLLGYLPLGPHAGHDAAVARRRLRPAVLADASLPCRGGHAAIRVCLHDALRLARAAPRAGPSTDLVPGDRARLLPHVSGLRGGLGRL